MVDDGIGVAKFLRKHLNKKKIIIEGGAGGRLLQLLLVGAISCRAIVPAALPLGEHGPNG